MTFRYFAANVCATEPEPRTSAAEEIASTGGCQLERHNGSFLVVTASDSRLSASVVYRTRIGFADTARPGFLTRPVAGTRATMVFGGLGKSARLP